MCTALSSVNRVRTLIRSTVVAGIVDRLMPLDSASVRGYASGHPDEVGTGKWGQFSQTGKGVCRVM